MEGIIQKDVGTTQLGLSLMVSLVPSIVSRLLLLIQFHHQKGLRKVERHNQGYTVGNVKTVVPTQGSLPDWLLVHRTGRGAVQLCI